MTHTDYHYHLIGKKFGRLTLLGNFQNKKNCKLADFRCDCGNLKTIRLHHVLSVPIRIRSCGCYNKGKHNHCIKGKTSKAYKAWSSMKARCNNPNNKSYALYGGRGIKVCKEWKCFDAFYKDMGDAPRNLSLDRLDNSKGYYKENCRWATMSEQSRNRRSNNPIYYNGEYRLAIEWAELLGATYDQIKYRARNNLPLLR